MRFLSRLVLLGGVLCVLIISIFLFSNLHSQTITFSDPEVLADNPVRIPPTTYRDAIYVSFSLPEVRSSITTEHEHLTRQASNRVKWQATANASRVEGSSETYWSMTFRCTSYRPSFICNVSFTDSGIVQGMADIECGHETIK